MNHPNDVYLINARMRELERKAARATSLYNEYMTDFGGHDLYADLNATAEAEHAPWSDELHIVMNQAIDAALALFGHPHYPLAETIIDFVTTIYDDYGPATRAAAATFLRTAGQFNFAHERTP